MGKNKKSKIVYNNIALDSLEEYQFFCWLEEAKELNVVYAFEYQPDEFLLTNKKTYIPIYNNPKQKEKHLFREHIYTADFKIQFNAAHGEILSKVFKIDASMLINETITVYVDIKGSFNRNGGDRLFSIHQKLVYEKYGVLVQKIVPKEVFKHLGIAKASLYTPTGRPSKIYSSYNFIPKMFGI